MLNVLWGITGIVVIIGISFLFSNNKKKINWRTIFVGIGINVVFAFLILNWNLGRTIFQFITDTMNTVVGYGQEGIDFLFGELFAEGTNITSVTAISILGMIIFFASIISVLYHLGIMQLVVKYLGGALSKLLGTSKEESTSAAANIFMGHTEAPLVIKPFINKLSQSELFTVMTGGLASVAGTMLALYATLGVSMQYLLIASFMSAASGIIIAKVFFPEIKKVVETDRLNQLEEQESNQLDANFDVINEQEKSENIIDAAQNGAVNGMNIGLAVLATLLALVSIISLLNGVLGFIGGWFNIELSMQSIFGILFAPITFAIGIPWEDAVLAGSYVGEKLVLTEIVAFSNLIEDAGQLNERTVAIMSIALCGFANFGSMGSLMSMMSSVAPKRKSEVAKLALKSVIAGALASLLSASIVGMFL